MYYGGYNPYRILDSVGTLLTVLLVIRFVFWLVKLIGQIRIYQKMGYPGWYGIIPLFKSYILYEDLYRDGWLFWLSVVPGLNLYVIFRANTDWAHNFGKSMAFGVGLTLLPTIFNLILGYGGARYTPRIHAMFGMGGAVQEAPAQASEPPRPKPPVKKLPAGAPKTIPPFQDKRCCVCNRALEGGAAVLFTNEYGAKAKICDKCGAALDALSNSEDRRVVQSASSYIRGRMDSVDPKVAERLGRYVDDAEAFLRN